MKHVELFDLIAPFYALFYTYQRKGYKKSLDLLFETHDFNFESALDVGCGTGALTAELSKRFPTTGLDGAKNMIHQAQRLSPSLTFVHNDVSHGLPCEDDSFDLVISSFVLHGLSELQRLELLKEMKRVSRKTVILIDYHEGKHPLISLIEWIEHGDYFRFMDHFKEEIPMVFDRVSILKTNSQSAFYILS